MDDGMLIDLVHSYPHLYDRKRSDFKDTRKKENSWQEIANLLKYSVIDVQNRWKYLREKYSRERSHNAPSGSGAPDKPQWELFHALSWLEVFMQKRKTKTNISASIAATEQGSQIENETEVTENFLDTNDPSFSPIYTESEMSSDYEPLPLGAFHKENNSRERCSTNNVQQEFPKGKASDNSYKVKAKKGISESSEVVSTIKDMGTTMKSALTAFQGKTYPKPENDEDELFGKMVTTLMKKMKNKKRKKEIKRKFYAELMESDSD